MMSGHKKALYNLAEGWLELESDPGLFTLLMEDMGVQGVQVEEIYDLQSAPLVQKKPCYGAIFLFKWAEDRRSRRKIVEEESLYVKDEEEINKIFFAQQIVPNSCATHALVSILLNCPQVNIGDTLMNLKNHVAGMNPENKGLAIGNSAQLAHAHNSHAVPRARRRFEKSNSSSLPGSRYTGEAFHFVSYVPINNRLFELDGLRRYPIDHGPIPDPSNWTEKLREVIQNRLGMSKGGVPVDIRFALMVLVPESRKTYQKRLRLLAHNREIIIKALRQLLEIYKAKKKSALAESSKSSGRSTRSSTAVPKTYREEDDVEFVDPSTSEEAHQLDKEVTSALDDFKLVFKEGVKLPDVYPNYQPSKPSATTFVKKEEASDNTDDTTQPDTSASNDKKSSNDNETYKTEDDKVDIIDLDDNDIVKEKEVKNEIMEVKDLDTVEVDATKQESPDDESEVVKLDEDEQKETGSSSNKTQIPEKLVNKPLLRVSRGSSAESCSHPPPLSPCSQPPPLSPFQSNPLLTAHDYSKSPLMEGCEDVSPPSCVEDDFEDFEDSDPLSSHQDPTDNYKEESLDKENNSSSMKDPLANPSDPIEVSCEDDSLSSQSNQPLSSTVNVSVDESVEHDPADDEDGGADNDHDPLAIKSDDALDDMAPELDESNTDQPKDMNSNGENSTDTCDDDKEKEVDTEGNIDEKNEADEEKITAYRWPLFSHSLQEDFPEFDPGVQVLRYPSEFLPADLLELLRRVEGDIYRTEISMKDDMEQHNKFVIDDCRRVHDYDEFINTFLLMLAEQNMLADLVEHGLGFKRSKLPATEPPPKASSKKPGALKCESFPSSSSGGSTSAKSRKKVKKRLDDSESDWSDEAPPQKQCKVMYSDPSLPKGWSRRVKKRGGSGLSHSKYTVIIINPEGKQFRTKGEIRGYLTSTNSELQPHQFDFSVSGNRRTTSKKK